MPKPNDQPLRIELFGILAKATRAEAREYWRTHEYELATNELARELRVIDRTTITGLGLIALEIRTLPSTITAVITCNTKKAQWLEAALTLTKLHAARHSSKTTMAAHNALCGMDVWDYTALQQMWRRLCKPGPDELLKAVSTIEGTKLVDLKRFVAGVMTNKDKAEDAEDGLRGGLEKLGFFDVFTRPETTEQLLVYIGGRPPRTLA